MRETQEFIDLLMEGAVHLKKSDGFITDTNRLEISNAERNSRSSSTSKNWILFIENVDVDDFAFLMTMLVLMVT